MTDDFAPLQPEAAKTAGKRVYKILSFDCPGQLLLDPNYRGELLVLQYFFNINLVFVVELFFWTVTTSMLLVKTNSSLKLKLFLIIFHL